MHPHDGIAGSRVDDAVVVADVARRVVGRLQASDLAVLLNEACFLEEKRLARAADGDDAAYRDLLRGVRRRLPRADRDVLLEMAEQLIAHYVREIHGHFDANTYATATRVLPKGLALLLERQSGWRLLREGLSGLDLAERMVVGGRVDAMKSLLRRGTCVLVPTHVSNMDSPVIGFAVHRAGLPPLIYGAGKNLFTNWLLSHFMDRLGAYRVDRLKKHEIYKEVLKEYSQYALERRWHSLFFPGGTRSRSGTVEKHVKKGLLGTGLAAYLQNLRSGVSHPRVFFVPATINYRLVLEAETLIADHLEEAGKARYIISDDEFSKPSRVIDFTRRMLAMDSSVDVVIGEACDPFGNPVDDAGDSLDPHGRPFDPAGYLTRSGEVHDDPQRDREYTERLGESLVASWHRDTVVFETHVVAHALLRLLRARHPGMDLWRLLLLHDDARTFPLQDLDREVARVLDGIAELSARGRIRPFIAVDGGAQAVRRAGVERLGLYHSVACVRVEHDRAVLAEPRLALYYSNRLEGFPLVREEAA
jgi:glycerol-3-phosphate O-acyltransferase